MTELRVGAQLAQELEPAHARHADVEQDDQVVQIGAAGAQKVERLDSVVRDGDAGHCFVLPHQALHIQRVELVILDV